MEQKTEKIICRADIIFKSTVLSKVILALWYLIGIIVGVCGSIPKVYGTHTRYYFFTAFIADIKKDTHGVIVDEFVRQDNLIIGIILFILFFIVPTLIALSNKCLARCCTLSVMEKGVYGERKTLFSMRTIQLPIEKVDNIMVIEGFMDKIRGGKTVAIRSNSGLVKFPWCHNADEFVAATMQRIEVFKKENSGAATPAPAAPSVPAASLTEKLQELQSLKEQGILTEEQFEAKKQQLLANF